MIPTYDKHIEHMIGVLHGALAQLTPQQAGSYKPADTVELLDEVLKEGIEALRPMGMTLPDVRLAERYDLNGIELFVLWLVLAPHLDPAMRDRIARANDNITRDWVDPSLCLRVFCAHRDQKTQMMGLFSSAGRLIERGLLRLEPRDRLGSNRLYHELVPWEQLPTYVLGMRAISPTAAPFARWINPSRTETPPLPLELEDFGRALSHFYTRPAPEGVERRGALRAYPAGVALLIQGSPGSGRSEAALALAGALERNLIMVEGQVLKNAAPGEAAAALQGLFKEGELYDEVVCVRDASALIAPDQALAVVLAQEMQRRRVAVIFCVGKDEPVDATLDAVVLLRRRLRTNTHAILGDLWRAAIPRDRVELRDVDFEALSDRINLSPLQVRKAAHLSYLMADLVEARALDVDDDRAARLDDASPVPAADGAPRVVLDAPLLERAARAQLSKSIGAMAIVSEPEVGLNDLILDDHTDRQVREVISAARNRRKVLYEWGIGERIRRGTGIIALFDGDPGTGKTHSAEAIASELGLSLVRVNISGIVDKYIGETEKNLTRVFEQVRSDISLLLFDEADSLFSKRTAKVEKATDRYSNMDINVLLQLVERYEGVTVLTTNLKKAIDPAFERRFTYKIHFKMPEIRERYRIWKYLLPEHIDTAEPIDYRWLASVELTGGEIKNAILLAAYSAAHESARLSNEHLFEAAQREAAAAGRIIRRYEGS